MNKNNLLIFFYYWYRHTLSTFEKKLHAGGGLLFERVMYLYQAIDMRGGIVFVVATILVLEPFVSNIVG